MLKLQLGSSPQHLFDSLLRHQRLPILLESSQFHPHYGRYTIMTANPVETLVFHPQPPGSIPDVSAFFTQLKHKLNTLGAPIMEQTLPYFTGGAIGYLSYDLGQSLWPQHRVGKIGLWPECVFHFYEWSLVYDRLTREYYLFDPQGVWAQPFSEYEVVPQKSAWADFQSPPLTPNFSKSDYLEAIRTIQNWIREGDVYQVNLSQRFHTEVRSVLSAPELAWSLYRRLMRVNPGLFATFFPVTEESFILSASPELFLRLSAGQATLRPIKGTAPRHADPTRDAQERQRLRHSPKDLAELMMIVDLARNDLGKVCQYGTIQVPELVTLESYATVHHLVSTITGQLRLNADIFDLLLAAFPCGSITGAPKLRAMERIHQLEPTARGPYTGSIGWIDFAGNACFNVAIRTLLLRQAQLSFQVGGGIVIDSDPQREYEETLHKGQGLAQVLGLPFF